MDCVLAIVLFLFGEGARCKSKARECRRNTIIRPINRYQQPRLPWTIRQWATAPVATAAGATTMLPVWSQTAYPRHTPHSSLSHHLIRIQWQGYVRVTPSLPKRTVSGDGNGSPSAYSALWISSTTWIASQLRVSAMSSIRLREKFDLHAMHQFIKALAASHSLIKVKWRSCNAGALNYTGALSLSRCVLVACFDYSLTIYKDNARQLWWLLKFVTSQLTF